MNLLGKFEVVVCQDEEVSEHVIESDGLAVEVHVLEQFVTVVEEFEDLIRDLDVVDCLVVDDLEVVHVDLRVEDEVLLVQVHWVSHHIVETIHVHTVLLTRNDLVDPILVILAYQFRNLQAFYP